MRLMAKEQYVSKDNLHLFFLFLLSFFLLFFNFLFCIFVLFLMSWNSSFWKWFSFWILRRWVKGTKIMVWSSQEKKKSSGKLLLYSFSMLFFSIFFLVYFLHNNNFSFCCEFLKRPILYYINFFLSFSFSTKHFLEYNLKQRQCGGVGGKWGKKCKLEAFNSIRRICVCVCVCWIIPKLFLRMKFTWCTY